MSVQTILLWRDGFRRHPPSACGGRTVPSAERPSRERGAGAPMSPQQLDDLVAPIALYPDPLVGEVLAASTYPMEIAEAEQWVRDHPHWKPSKLMDKAKKQNWDPSIQGLVAFPDVLTRLDPEYELDHATWQCLSRPASGRDAGGAAHAGQSRGERDAPFDAAGNRHDAKPGWAERSISIEPANPDVWYVPNYNPAYVWGPPDWGVYPPLLYPGIDAGSGVVSRHRSRPLFWRLGRLGLGRLGMGPQLVRREYLHRPFFLSSLRFPAFPRRRRPLGSSVWMHDPEHRLGVPYANREVAGRFARNGAFGGGEPGDSRGARPRASIAGSWRLQQRFGNPAFEQRGWTGNHSVFGGYHNGGMTRMQSDHGFSSMGAGRIGGFGGAGGGMRSGGDSAVGCAAVAGCAVAEGGDSTMTGKLCTICAAMAIACAAPSIAQERFDSPEAAAQAVIDAADNHDSARLSAIFGPQAKGHSYLGRSRAGSRRTGRIRAPRARQAPARSLSHAPESRDSSDWRRGLAVSGPHCPRQRQMEL